MQSVLQQEEGIRDDDEVEALGASVEHVGQTIESTKVKYQWVFRIAGVDHVVEFFNSKLSGRKKLCMDSKLIYTQQQLRMNGFEYSWPCSGHLLSVIYDLHAQAFALTINGLSFQLFYRRSDIENQRPHDASYSPSPPTSPVAPHQRYDHQQQRYQYANPQHQLLRGAAPSMASPLYAHQAHEPQQQQHQQHEGLGSSSGYRIRVSPPASLTQARDDADLLDLVSSTGCPSSPCISNSGTRGPSLGPPVAGSGSASSADDELAQLDSTFWSEPPHTPDFPAPAGPPEGPSEAPLPASTGPSSQALYCQGPAANMPVQDREQDGARSGTGSTGGFPARAPSKPKGEPLFADLMKLASDKLNISLSPRNRLGGPTS